ncbi:apolipoprotein A-II [Embiotoca jacksoni]|uniref:apolipoprotein A-II n=1 Tax=Embiotoca jacksoni TaxID=100190 RepID=UPI003703FE49
MNAKYVLALVLALQVSLSLCQDAQPSQELVDKYNSLKAVFFKRLMNAYSKLQMAAGPYVDQASTSARTVAAREFVEDLTTKEEFKAIVKVASGIGAEAGPMVDRMRSSALGLYEHYLRPHFGDSLSKAIDHAKLFLDQILPAE